MINGRWYRPSRSCQGSDRQTGGAIIPLGTMQGVFHYELLWRSKFDNFKDTIVLD